MTVPSVERLREIRKGLVDTPTANAELLALLDAIVDDLWWVQQLDPREPAPIRREVFKWIRASREESNEDS